jgi:hypothetical protein
VDELRGLILNRRDDLGMAVPGVGDRDPCGDVEEEIAVHILDDAPAAAFDEQRVCWCVRGRNVRIVLLQQLRALGAG